MSFLKNMFDGKSDKERERDKSEYYSSSHGKGGYNDEHRRRDNNSGTCKIFF